MPISFRKLATALALVRKERAAGSFAWFACRYLSNIVLRRRLLLWVYRPTSSIGDLLCVAPCLGELRKTHPRAWIVFSCSKTNRDLARATRVADTVIADSDPHHFLLNHLGHRPRFALLPDEISPSRHRPKRPIAAEFAAALETSAPQSGVRLTIPPRVHERVANALARLRLKPRGFVVVHAGPTWKVKEWPDASWRELIALLQQRYALPIVQVGADLTTDRQTRQPTRLAGAHDLCGKLTLLETAALLSQARLFVGIDSGPLHLAAAVNCPSVSLFGPTDGAAIIASAAPVRVLQAPVPCTGCHHASSGPVHWREDCPEHIACMRSLSPTDVLAEIENLLGADHPVTR